MTTATTRLLGAIRLSLLAAGLLFSMRPAWSDDVPADKLTTEEQQRLLDLEKEKMFLAKEKDLLTAKNELAKAKVDAATPATAAGVTALSGAVTGANDMTFAMYMASLEGLEQVAQALCNDLGARGIGDVFVTSKDAMEAAAKNEATSRARTQLARKLTTARTQVDQMTAWIGGTSAISGPKISAASLTAIASGIDIATGLVKGVAGLASLFKSERTIHGVDNLLTQAEMSAALSMCVDKAPRAAAPTVNYVDNDADTLTAKIGQITNEVADISTKAEALDASVTKMLIASDRLDADLAIATKAKDAAKLKALNARKPPPNFDTFKTKATGLVTQAEAYVDAFYQVDATTGLSPLIVSAQFRAVSEAMQNKGRLSLTLLRSGGYSLTTKRLILNDRVDFAGGLAVRATVTKSNGTLLYDRVFYRDSGWIRADFSSSSESPKRSNFTPVQ